jgi:hypothetical protein
VNGVLARAAALALLAGGIVLLVMGVNGMNSPSSDISRFLTGAPTDRATWMLAGGAAMVVAGLAGVLPGFRKR